MSQKVETEAIFGKTEEPKPHESSKQGSVIMGPRPYNRFLGNPPPGVTPEQAFKEENGYDWIEELSITQMRDRLIKLQVENNQLKQSQKKT